MRALALALALFATPAAAQTTDHGGHDMAGMDHAGPQPDAPVADEVGNAAPPPVPGDHPADRFFAPDRMAVARAALGREGRFRSFAVLADTLDYRAVSGGDG